MLLETDQQPNGIEILDSSTAVWWTLMEGTQCNLKSGRTRNLCRDWERRLSVENFKALKDHDKILTMISTINLAIRL